jgi:hypothetical protein
MFGLVVLVVLVVHQRDAAQLMLPRAGQRSLRVLLTGARAARVPAVKAATG